MIPDPPAGAPPSAVVAPQLVVLEIGDMTDADSAARVTAAVAAVDAEATVRIDLQRRSVDIVSSCADAYDFVDAIAAVGCTPVLLLWHAFEQD